MSDFGTIIDAALAAAAGAVAGLTTYRELRDPVSGFSRGADYPVLMGAGVAAPSTEADHFQEERNIGFVLYLCTHSETQESTYQKADAIRAALYADRTLGGVVERLNVANMEPFESPDSPVQGMVVTVTTRRYE